MCPVISEPHISPSCHRYKYPSLSLFLSPQTGAIIIYISDRCYNHLHIWPLTSFVMPSGVHLNLLSFIWFGLFCFLHHCSFQMCKFSPNSDFILWGWDVVRYCWRVLVSTLKSLGMIVFLCCFYNTKMFCICYCKKNK